MFKPQMISHINAKKINLALNSGLQILPIDYEVCILSLSSILLAVWEQRLISCSGHRTPNWVFDELNEIIVLHLHSNYSFYFSFVDLLESLRKVILT